ncbi:MAG TPA: class I SAM-dependent methyltransferase [Nostocaceae cyanobacterium]|nr:class I SAM-dependent methyltransferase [Nostocaceae cyanobacterium]
MTIQQQFTTKPINNQRLNCSICNYHVNLHDESVFANFPCCIRAFKDESFKVWRCPNCQTIHCLDVVDLDYYFAPYPNAKAQLTWPFRFIYGNLCSQLIKHGFSKNHSLLDYGCGPNGLFIQYLRERGFVNTYGYDPYGSDDGFGNVAVLQQEQFDYITFMYAIGHIEDPNPVLSQLNQLLAPGGYIFIGTPNAANIDLNKPNLPDNYIPAHFPHQPHIYTRETLEQLGRNQGWQPIDFGDRKFDDTPWFGFNHRAYNTYIKLMDGSVDVLLEPLQLWKALTSPQFLFYATFGYWLSIHADMNIIFRRC